jgi:serine phosphatase RsbU (regulator of sigma subunit)
VQGGSSAPRSSVESGKRRRAPKAARIASVVLVVVVLGLTAVAVWASSRANDNSNSALLKLEVSQVASTLGADLSSVQSQLGDAVNEATATHSTTAFKAFVATRVGPGGLTSESLWQSTPSGIQLVAVQGTQPQIVHDNQAAAFFSHLRPSSQLQVTSLLPGNPPRVGYAEYPPGNSPYIVYAETALPANKKLTIPANSPFGQLNYAVFLGPHATASTLIASSVPVPVQGLQRRASIPFGNTALTVVATPRAPLSSTVSSDLPWILLGAGIVLALAGVAILEYVGRRRRHAEAMAEELQRLHAEQRSIATTLQRALLPESLPAVAGLELGARYLPGADGLEVGGDWYDFVALDDGRLVFVVGDVSGRGVKAASVMASLRFAGHAFALEGHAPHKVIERLRRVLDVGRDGYIATVLCGRIDVGGHQLEIASAGHPPPVICSKDSCAALQLSPSPPIGLGNPGSASSASPSTTLPPGSTVLAFTDGLVERRHETWDDSIGRLETSAGRASETVDGLLNSIVSDLTGDSPSDDVAVIGIRWLN